MNGHERWTDDGAGSHGSDCTDEDEFRKRQRQRQPRQSPKYPGEAGSRHDKTTDGPDVDRACEAGDGYGEDEPEKFHDAVVCCLTVASAASAASPLHAGLGTDGDADDPVCEVEVGSDDEEALKAHCHGDGQNERRQEPRKKAVTPPKSEPNGNADRCQKNEGTEEREG